MATIVDNPAMTRHYLAAFFLILCQGCDDGRITWSFPALQITNADECIVGYTVVLNDDAYLVDVQNMSYDWDMSYDRGIWRSYLTTAPCFPEIVGGCHSEAAGFLNSKDLPRFVFKLHSKTNALWVTGAIHVITNWITWETRSIPFDALNQVRD